LKQHFAEIGLDSFGFVAGNIQPYFVHHLDRQRVYTFRLQTGAVGFETVTSVFP
jgi:hypothetical protein